jgi:hypothetical protein
MTPSAQPLDHILGHLLQADTRRQGPGAAKGNNHALKHGRYTAESIAEPREKRRLLNFVLLNCT